MGKKQKKIVFNCVSFLHILLNFTNNTIKAIFDSLQFQLGTNNTIKAILIVYSFNWGLLVSIETTTIIFHGIISNFLSFIQLQFLTNMSTIKITEYNFGQKLISYD